jgi:hypothetical protein
MPATHKALRPGFPVFTNSVMHFPGQKSLLPHLGRVFPALSSRLFALREAQFLKFSACPDRVSFTNRLLAQWQSTDAQNLKSRWSRLNPSHSLWGNSEASHCKV